MRVVVSEFGFAKAPHNGVLGRVQKGDHVREVEDLIETLSTNGWERPESAFPLAN